MQFTKFNDINIHYCDEGPVEGLPVVFSNSLGTDFRIWDDLIARIKSDFAAQNENSPGLRFVRYDKRGHGLTDAPVPPYAMDEHVGDLVGLLDHLSIDSAIVIGLSVGGMITQSLAAKFPHRVRGIVLSNTGHKIGNDKLWNSRIDQIAKNGIKSISDDILERWFSAGFPHSEPVKLAICRNMLERTSLNGYLGTCAALRDCDLSDIAAKLKVPTLLIAGSEDGSTPPENMRQTHMLIANSNFEIIEGAGHLPCLEQPAKTASLILKFMKDHSIR